MLKLLVPTKQWCHVAFLSQIKIDVNKIIMFIL